MSKKPNFRVEKSKDIDRQAWVYYLTGKFMGSQECYDFLEDARDMITDDSPNVVLQMAEVGFINSTGIGIIASLLTSSGNKKGKLYLIAPSESALRQLKVTHVWDYLTVVDQMDDLPV